VGFIKKYLSPSTLGLGAEYVKFETLKSRLEEQRPQIYEKILELQEAELNGKSDAQTLQEAQTALVDCDQKIQAADKAMTRVLAAIPPALTKDIDSQFKKVGKLKSELDRRQAAAARRVHLAQEVAAFFQGTDLSGLETVSGKLAELQGEIQTISKDPEALDFQDLTAMVAFLDRVWAEPPRNSSAYQAVEPDADWKTRAAQAAKNLSGYLAAGPGDLAGVRLMEHEGHLRQFEREILAAAREQAGVDAPTPGKAAGPGFLSPIYALLTGKKE
jgi:chromosome segregation ATPase